MASIALPHVSTENDRQINLSQRVLSTRCERSTFASLQSLTGYVSRCTLNSIISQRPGTADTQRTSADHSVHKALGVRWLVESTLLLVQTSTWFYLATYNL